MDRQKNIDARENYSQKKRHDNNSLLGLPEDVFCYVLSRLAAKCLYSNARYVCKPWATIIRSSHFIETQLCHANPGLFVQSTAYPYGAYIFDIKENEQFEVTDKKPQYPGRFLNSFQGLALFYQYATGIVYVANPITMQVARVPDLLKCKLAYPPCAIVRVPRTGEFKLFAAHVQMQRGVSICHWYVLRLGIEDSWKIITTQSGDFDFKCSPVYTGGSDLYWITEHSVILLDVDKETFLMFSHPQGRQWQPQYLRMGDCLSSVIFLKHVFQIHIFDTNSGKWTLYHQMEGFKYPNPSYNALSESFCAWMNQEVIFKTIRIPSCSTLVFGYNLKTGIVRTIATTNFGFYDVGLHTSTLVSW
ncbi:hypothetical protein L6164_002519 [Bauhinia variegata]|uniref:Uncharacterized protein n=1 Tax=Bauhinia variegata TaxID=167791 RepID=A0ACB9PZ08_BAUVA|nr:hypothetical protein L6164_002519 [Bauhinia variegata]